MSAACEEFERSLTGNKPPSVLDEWRDNDPAWTDRTVRLQRAAAGTRQLDPFRDEDAAQLLLDVAAALETVGCPYPGLLALQLAIDTDARRGADPWWERRFDFNRKHPYGLGRAQQPDARNGWVHIKVRPPSRTVHQLRREAQELVDGIPDSRLGSVVELLRAASPPR